MDAVRLSHVSKSYGSHRAVEDLNLVVPEGAVYGFIGPNGSGKTTTIRTIMHIIQPDSGEVEVLGKTGVRAASDEIGYLPEERGLYKKMTVRRQLVFFASLKNMPERQARKAADAWLERLGLEKWAEKKIEALSKGMAQKVQFISAVITGPRLVILDEPFSGLDPVNMEVLRGAILEMHKAGTTFIFSTHDMHIAETMCDFVFMIYKGKKVLDGTLAAIKREYGTDTIRLRTDAGRAAVEGIAGVESVLDHGACLDVRFRGDRRQLLAQLVARGEVHHFEVAHPSLHDIFLRIAGPEAANPSTPAARQEVAHV